MPRISAFYGIVIWMYHDEAHHSGRPHFHAVYGGDEATIELIVRDEGAGLPAGFDLRAATGMGMRIVQAFARQLNARIAVHDLEPGTEFVVAVPAEVSS